MIRADHEACGVRDDEPDEAEEPHDGDGARGEEGGECREHDARALDGKPHAARHVVTEEEDVEPSRREQSAEPRPDGVRQEHLDVRPAPCGESADHPHERAVDAIAVEDHHGGDARAEECRDGDAREDDARRSDAGTPREEVDEEGGEHCPAERRGGDEPRCARQDEHDKDARQPCAGGDADDVRVGERVPQDRLQDRSREGEVHADEGCDDGARQSDVPEDLGVCRVSHTAEGSGDLRAGDVHRALCRRYDTADDGEHGKEHEDEDAFSHG